MGTICILLGIIELICMSVAGAVVGNFVVHWKAILAITFTDLANTPDRVVLVGIIAVFVIVGLTICAGTVTQGLTYNKVVKIQKRVKHL